MSLHAAVNLLWMVHGEVGGSETYTLTHLQALADHGGHDLRVTAFALPGFAERHPAMAERFEVVEAPVTGQNRAARVAIESTWLSRRVAQCGAQVIHHPGGTLPLRSPVPTVLTIHDLQWVTFPRYFSRAKITYLRSRVAPSIRRADVVMVNSQYVRRTVAELAGVDESGVVVVPPAVGSLPVESTDPDEACRRHGVESPYFLYPAITYPHKNHLALVWALSAMDRDDVHLVLTGGVASMETAIETEVGRLGLRDRVHRLGRIPREDLEGLYQRAAAVVFPSTYEGFGMGVVEAMRRGCPVIAADATALPEVVGDDALVVPAGDPDGWAACMTRMLDEPGLAAALGRAGRERVGRFDPVRVAETVESAYRRAAGV